MQEYVLSKLPLERVASRLGAPGRRACHRFCTTVNTAVMGSDVREHRLEGIAGREFFLPYRKPFSSSLGISCFLFC